MPLLVDVGALVGVSVLPAVVGIVVSIWVVCVGTSTVQVYMHVDHYSNRQLYSVQTIPVSTSFTAGCRLMLGPLTAHTFTL